MSSGINTRKWGSLSEDPLPSTKPRRRKLRKAFEGIKLIS